MGTKKKLMITGSASQAKPKAKFELKSLAEQESEKQAVLDAELKMAIKSVLGGKFFISPGISAKVIEGYLENKKPQRAATPWESLTAREKGILKLIAEGYKNKEIADFLCISVKTVEKHRANLMQKLDLHSVSALTALAIEKELITK